MSIPKAVWGSWYVIFRTSKLPALPEQDWLLLFASCEAATYHLTAPESDAGRDSKGCLRFGFFFSPVARALNYVYLILYNSVMLYYDSNVLMITKAFELLVSILQPLYLNKNDALSSIHNHFLAKILPVLLSFNDEGGCSVDCPLLMLTVENRTSWVPFIFL